MDKSPLLELGRLDVFYGRAQVLFSLDLELSAGEALAVLGRNGVGKTTLLQAIMKQGPKLRGEVRFEDRAIQGLASYQIARLGLGYVPQDKRLFSSLTVLENLASGARSAKGQKPFWDLEKIFALFPNLYDLRNRPALWLSGGEQQMLALARSLLGNPRLLLLDEATEGLSPQVSAQLQEALSAWKAEGNSLLIAEQNLAFVEALCERFHFLESGRISTTYSRAELAADPGLIARTLGLASFAAKL